MKFMAFVLNASIVQHKRGALSAQAVRQYNGMLNSHIPFF